MRIDGTERELVRSGQLAGHGWTHHYFAAPDRTRTSVVTAVTFDLSPRGSAPAIDNIVFEAEPDTLAPPGITNLTVKTGRRGGSIEARWTAVDGGGSDGVAYYLARTGPRVFDPASSAADGSLSEHPARKPEGKEENTALLLEPGRTYFVSVAAVDEHGHRGPFCPPQACTANTQPLKLLAYDFENGSGEGCRASTPKFKLRVRPVPGSAKANKALVVEFEKEGEWDFLTLNVDPLLVASHRYLTMRVKGNVKLLGKLWAGEENQADVETLQAADGTFTLLRFDMDKAPMTVRDREQVERVLLFPEPGKPGARGTFMIDDVGFEN
jgi:hypothetical protein